MTFLSIKLEQKHRYFIHLCALIVDALNHHFNWSYYTQI